MHEFKKPNIVISKCLGFDFCRYDGQIINDDFIKKLGGFVHYIPVCPEVEIGLGIPRFPVRLLSLVKDIRFFQPSTGMDYTDEMLKFCEDFLNRQNDIDGFILKSRSPSCGFKDVKIYSKTEKSAPVQKSSGLFGGKVLEKFHHIAIEDEGRLKDFKIREHFLTRIFALSSFRILKQKPEMSVLVNFHSRNKYLLMSYNQAKLKVLGKIVANHEKNEPKKVYKAYETVFQQIFMMQPKVSSNINVMQHIFGYFSKELSKNERAFFLDTIALYRDGRIPFISALRMLKGWVIRFDEKYLVEQTFFEPFPEKLVDLYHSGKKLDL